MDASAHYEACTRGIRVRAQAEFLAERSRPDRDLWLFGYRIQILNEGVETVQLLGRHWIILDAAGRREEVRGSGLLMGIRVKPPYGDVIAACTAEKLLTVGAGDNVVRLLPPLNVTEAEVAESMRRLSAALKRVAAPAA